jgi:hypothetical protein
MTKRAYRNENIYRIIGGLHCLRVTGGAFVCGSAQAIKARTTDAPETPSESPQQ